MAAEGSEAEDRTEAPSQRRLDRAREDGQVPLSREVVAASSLLLAALAAVLALPWAGQGLMLAMRGLLGRLHELGPLDGWGLALPAILALLPVAGAAAVGAIAATLLQTGFLLSGQGLRPKLSNLDPRKGLARLVGPQGLAELLRALVKIGAVALAVRSAAADAPPLRELLVAPAAALLSACSALATSLMMHALMAYAAIAAADLFWVRFQHLRRLRMSRQDMKEEAKESDGDPHIKARIRQLRQQRAKRRMMAAVPKATVVVTNPTHFAVALAYEDGQSAPRIVAKGADEVAARIRELARASGVPLMSNPPLARALFRLEIEPEIPPEPSAAVAEIIAYVLRRRGGATATG